MVLGRLFGGGGSPADRSSPSRQDSVDVPDVQSRCLADAQCAQDSGLVPQGRPVLFVDLEGTLMRTFSRDDLREIPKDTHRAPLGSGGQLLIRIRPFVMEFLARMKRDRGLAVAVYAASPRSAVAAKVEVLERSHPGFHFDFVIDQDTANAWEDGIMKRLRLILGTRDAACLGGFLIDTKENYVKKQESGGGPGAPHAIVSAVAIPEFGPFIADKNGQLADTKIVYGTMTSSQINPSYNIFKDFEEDNPVFKAWLQKVRGDGGQPEQEEVDWELVESADSRARIDGNPVLVDEFLFIESGTANLEGAVGEGAKTEAAGGCGEDTACESERARSAWDQSTQSAPEEKPSSQEDSADGSSTTTADEDLIYRCFVCQSPLFKGFEIVSSNFNAQSSPGYLLSAVRNVQISNKKQTAVYTTGRYEILEVCCAHCSAGLGITYTSAPNMQNQYKVGKYLVGRDRLQLPPGVVHPMEK